MISIKKLVAIDMTLNGKWLIFIEFVVGTFGSLVLAYLLSDGVFWKLWLTGIGINYFPLTLYSWIFILRNEYKKVASEVMNVSKYNRQQLLILIPFFVALVSIIQLFQKNNSNQSTKRY